LGDEWFNPTTNKFYKFLAVSGNSPQWVEMPAGTNNNMTVASGMTVSGTGTFTGSPTNLAASFNNILENAYLSGLASGGTVNFDVTTQAVLYSVASSTSNWTLNIRGSSSVTFNSLLATGQSCSLAYLATNGGTGYFNNAITIDGVAVTPKYQGGTAIASGNTSAIDVYTYTIIKTGNAAYTVLMSQTKFA
jgi:hypothetical protein